MLLSLKRISRTYCVGGVEVKALHDVTLDVRRGEFITLMGPSGSGKTTLLNIVGCLHKPSAGSYILEGQNIEQLSEARTAEIRNRKIGFVFQAFHLLPRLTALRNVEVPLIYRGNPKETRIDAAKAALEAVGLGERLHHLPSELSGGEQQRVAIARALVTKPPLLLADEPTGNLDSASGKKILALLSDLHEMGKTILLVTHEKECAFYSSRTVCLRDGKIVSDEVPV